VRFFRGADCDTDHYLVTASVRKRLSVTKLSAQKSDVENFILKKVSDLKVRKQYQTKISKGFWLYRTYVTARAQIGLLKSFERISKSQLKEV
jgi:hypothetical protein